MSKKLNLQEWKLVDQLAVRMIRLINGDLNRRQTVKELEALGVLRNVRSG